MKTRRLVVLLFVYLLLDLGNPMMPGAFAFDVTDSIEAARTGRLLDAPVPGPIPVTPVVTPAASLLGTAAAPSVRRPRTVTKRRLFVRRVPSPSAAPATPSDDH